MQKRQILWYTGEKPNKRNILAFTYDTLIISLYLILVLMSLPSQHMAYVGLTNILYLYIGMKNG